MRLVITPLTDMWLAYGGVSKGTKLKGSGQ
jgi:hypothetical protein